MSRFDQVRASRRQLLAGLVALPLSLGPFVAYGTLTAEGRLLRDRAHVAISEPQLPALSSQQADLIERAAPRYGDAVMPLVYHGIGAGTDGGSAISPERFGEHLAALRAAGMSFVTASEVADAFAGRGTLPDNAVMISFDDGRNDALLWATPLLEAAGAVATMFVITEQAESRSTYYADWGKLVDEARSGVWDLQSHAAGGHVDHDTDDGPLPALTSLAPGETIREFRERVRADLGAASDELTDRLGRRPVAFAYPFGAHGTERTNDPRIHDLLGREVARHHALAFHQDDQDSVPLATADSAPLDIRRLAVEDWSGTELLRRIAAAADRTEKPSRR